MAGFEVIIYGRFWVITEDISAASVLKAAHSMGVKFSGKNPKASIITILGRLVRDGELERERGTIKVRFRSRQLGPHAPD
jgi:hypothetical protein